MSTSHIVQALNDINVVLDDKASIYQNSSGQTVARVTDIISSMIHSDGLMYWANSLGFKGIRYKDELNRAANAGTIAHAAIEKFLKEKLCTDNNIPFLGFKLWYDTVTLDIGLPISVIYVEHTITCRWFGGTLDALLIIGNKVYLVDFKTSNHVTYRYFIQLGAYRHMLREVENINIDGVIVLQLDKNEPGFNEYLLDFSIYNHLDFMNHCENTFLSLTYAYYNIKQIEGEYKTLF